MSEQFYTSTLKKRRRGQRMTPEQRVRAQAMFLAAYEKTASILKAAEQAEIDRTLVYYWQEHDERFMFAFNIADKAANMYIEAEIHRRAIEGWDEPLVSAGKHMGTVHKYSDILLMFYAKKRMPEYREKFEVNGALGVGGQVGFYPVQLPQKEEHPGAKVELPEKGGDANASANTSESGGHASSH